MEIQDFIKKQKEVEVEKNELLKALGVYNELTNAISPVERNKTGYEKYLGKNLFIRTVTHHYIGHCTETTNMTLTIDKASWVPSDGRFHETLKDINNVDEQEPYVHPVTINLYSICDVTEIDQLIQVVK